MSTTRNKATASELRISKWINAAAPITLASLRGKVVVIEAFQMLCPSCVSHGLPQAAMIAETFDKDDVVVLGLHCVFEHHDAMQPHALEAFLHEYRIKFPVGIDQAADPGTGDIPKTMMAYQLRGTPSLLLIDRAGRLRVNHFGQAHDMRVAAEISKLIFETVTDDKDDLDTDQTSGDVCTPDGCTTSSNYSGSNYS